MYYLPEIAEKEMKLGQILIRAPCVGLWYEIRSDFVEQRHAREFATHHTAAIFSLGNFEEIELRCSVCQHRLKLSCLRPEAGAMRGNADNLGPIWQFCR